MSRLFCSLALLVFASGVAAKPAPDATLTITSEPAGAAVYTLGKKRGVTPATFRLKDILPSLYKPEQLRMGTQVFVKMKGCETAHFPIKRRSIPEKIHADLECTDIPAAATTAPSAVTPPPATPAGSPAIAPAATTTRPAAAQTPAPVAAPAPKPVITPVEEPTFQFSTIREKLKELEELREEGLISEEEYQRLRKRVLGYF